jgi:hypothetical protein
VPTLSYNGVPNRDEEYLVKLGILPRAENLSKIVQITHKLLNSMENPHDKLFKVIKL